jgi:hypothetical protein
MTTRRAILRAAAVSPLAVGVEALARDATHLSGARLFADVKYYADLGEHRTAQRADARTALWLREELARSGFAARLQPFAVEREDIAEASLIINGEAIPVFPQWPVTWATDGAIEAPLLSAAWGSAGDSGACIVVTRLPPTRSASAFAPEILAPLQRMLSSPPAALVIITEGLTGGLIALNARPGLGPWPCPVALLAPRDAEPITLAIAQNDRARLVMRGARAAATAHNAVGEIGAGGAIVVTTPMSGWFRCAGERGGGVALWLAMARHVQARALPGRFVFASTSGHELGGLGGHAFLRERAPAPSDVRLWLHFGAGVATYAWSRNSTGLLRQSDGPDSQRYLTASTELRRLQLARLFEGQRAYTNPALVTGAGAVGEAALWLRAGNEDVVGFVAGHAFHHTPEDGPECTGPELLEPVADACAKLLEETALQSQ